LAAAKGM